MATAPKHVPRPLSATDPRDTLDERLAVALDSMTHGMCVYDADHRLLFSNERFKAIYRQPPHSVRPGTPFREMLAASIAAGNYPGRTVDEVWQERRAFIGQHKPGTFLQQLGDGRLIAISHTPLSDGGWVAVYADITEQRNAEQSLRYMAEHDGLTHLPNRVLFRRHLETAFEALAGTESFALLCLDLDGFKPVNDQHGHAAGDILLRLLAERLSGALREGDVAARLGGDEFAVLLPGTGRVAATQIATRLAAALGKPYDLGLPQTVTVGVSFGLACAPFDGRDPDALLERADQALYVSKRSGRGRLVSHMGGTVAAGPALAAERARQSADFAVAIQQGHLHLAYQPLFDGAGRLRAREALLRWTDPGLGPVSPADFIPDAEANGWIVPLTEWVLDTAAADAAGWDADVLLSVNLSPRCLEVERFVPTLERTVGRRNLAPTRLVLELTERRELSPSPAAAAAVRSLRDIGVVLWLDDFGTGHANLSVLRELPLGAVKIDRSFIADETETGVRLLRSMVVLARSCGLTVIAEGIETAEQHRRSLALGCDLFQGYALGRPAQLGSVTALIPSATRSSDASVSAAMQRRPSLTP